MKNGRERGLGSENEDLDAGLSSQLSHRARTGALRSQAIVDGACRFRRHERTLEGTCTRNHHGRVHRDATAAPLLTPLGIIFRMASIDYIIQVV